MSAGLNMGNIMSDNTQADDENRAPLLCFSRSGVPVNFSELLSRSHESSGVVFAPSGGGLRLRHLGEDKSTTYLIGVLHGH